MLTDHEATILEIMSKGEDMLAIGAHEAPILALMQRGLCRKVGNGYRITSEGTAAFDAFDEAQLRAMLGGRAVEEDGVTIEGEVIR